VVDLVNDVLRKRKYFNPQGWETRTNSSALVFIVFGTLSNISSSVASFVSVSITAGGDVDTLDTTGLGL
jgi:macrodomain Ter protein organizer (MatP/YcbG family)